MKFCGPGSDASLNYVRHIGQSGKPHRTMAVIMNIDHRTMSAPARQQPAGGTDDESCRPLRATTERLHKQQDLVVDDDVQRLTSGLAALTRRGDIDQTHVVAAERWYRDYVMGIIGARDPEAPQSGRAPDIHAAMLARTAAVARCRSIRQNLGHCSEIRLKLLLIDELSFSATAKHLFPGEANGRKKVAAQMSFLLEQLAEYYMLIDHDRTDRRVR